MSVLHSMKDPGSTADMSAVYDAFETAFYGSPTSQSVFRTLAHSDAYVMTAIKGKLSFLLFKSPIL